MAMLNTQDILCILNCEHFPIFAATDEMASRSIHTRQRSLQHVVEINFIISLSLQQKFVTATCYTDSNWFKFM